MKKFKSIKLPCGEIVSVEDIIIAPDRTVTLAIGKRSHSKSKPWHVTWIAGASLLPLSRYFAYLHRSTKSQSKRGGKAQ